MLANVNLQKDLVALGRFGRIAVIGNRYIVKFFILSFLLLSFLFFIFHPIPSQFSPSSPLLLPSSLFLLLNSENLLSSLFFLLPSFQREYRDKSQRIDDQRR
jgi:hypothetical protein